jgi:PTH1 family peptidyl-tRNA hydrolase
VGFWVVDRLCERAGVELKKKAFDARYAFAGTGKGLVCYVRPLTYVNLTGEAVRGFAEYYEVEPAEVLVVTDDLNLPVGKLRMRRDGSSGGHKGLDSVIRCLGTSAFPRLRIGIGQPPPPQDAADYVLVAPPPAEREALEAAVGAAADAVDLWIAAGIEAAMAKVNPPPAKEAKDTSKDAKEAKAAKETEPRGSKRPAES